MKIKNILLMFMLSFAILNANSFVKLQKPIKATNITLKNVDGITKSLDMYKGKKIILNFWASWCPPCKREMPSLQKFYSLYKNNVSVIAVASGQSEDDVFPFISQMKIEPTFEILYDEQQIASINYNIQAMPTSFIINKDGYITHYAIGEIDFMDKSFIDLILK